MFYLGLFQAFVPFYFLGVASDMILPAILTVFQATTPLWASLYAQIPGILVLYNIYHTCTRSTVCETSLIDIYTHTAQTSSHVDYQLHWDCYRAYWCRIAAVDGDWTNILSSHLFFFPLMCVLTLQRRVLLVVPVIRANRLDTFLECFVWHTVPVVFIIGCR